jgi:uncharacterized protein YeaO (DUF488 family)
MSDLHRIQVRRVYDDPAPGDGTRVLVDRIWPRGLTREKASLEEWCQQIAPSTALRKWYGHDPERFAEFTRRYHQELTEPERAQALTHLRELAKTGPLTLLTARDFCVATDLGYREESFVESFRQIVHHLSDVGAASRVQAPLAPCGARLLDLGLDGLPGWDHR